MKVKAVFTFLIGSVLRVSCTVAGRASRFGDQRENNEPTGLYAVSGRPP